MTPVSCELRVVLVVGGRLPIVRHRAATDTPRAAAHCATYLIASETRRRYCLDLVKLTIDSIAYLLTYRVDFASRKL